MGGHFSIPSSSFDFQWFITVKRVAPELLNRHEAPFKRQTFHVTFKKGLYPFTHCIPGYSH